MKKNLIQQQADDFMFYVVRNCSDYKTFIEQCSKAMLDYKKNIHVIVFLERLKELMKAGHDRHSQFCTASVQETCRFIKFYKIVLFYLQNEIDYQEKNLPFSYFKRNERRMLDQDIEEITSFLQPLSQQDKVSYLKFKQEISEMKSYYFLDKKNWKQLLMGKITVMKNAYIITPEQSTTLMNHIEQKFFFPA